MVEQSLLLRHGAGEVDDAVPIGGVRVVVREHPLLVVDPDVVAVLKYRTRKHSWKMK